MVILVEALLQEDEVQEVIDGVGNLHHEMAARTEAESGDDIKGGRVCWTGYQDWSISNSGGRVATFFFGWDGIHCIIAHTVQHQ